MNNRIKRIKEKQKLNEVMKKNSNEESELQETLTFEELSESQEKNKQELITRYNLTPTEFQMSLFLDYLHVNELTRELRADLFHPSSNIIEHFQKGRSPEMKDYFTSKNCHPDDAIITEFLETEDQEEVLQRLKQKGNMTDERVNNLRDVMESRDVVSGHITPKTPEYDRNPPLMNTLVYWTKINPEKFVVMVFADGKKNVKQFHKYWDKYLPKFKKKALKTFRKHAIENNDVIDFEHRIWDSIIDAVKSLSNVEHNEITASMCRFLEKQNRKIEKMQIKRMKKATCSENELGSKTNYYNN